MCIPIIHRLPVVTSSRDRPRCPENHEPPLDSIQEPIVEDTAQSVVPLLPPSGKIENKINEFENEPHFGIYQNTTEQLPSTRTILVPFGYPLTVFSDDNINDLYYHVVEKFPELAAPSIQICNIAKGRMTIISSDGNSTNMIRSRVETSAYRLDGRAQQVPILVLPNDEDSRIILSCTFDGFKDWDKLLVSIESDNFDGSFWMPRGYDDLPMNKYKITFSVDGISFYQLLKNDFKMKVDGESVKVDVVDNPFETDMNNFAGNGEM